MTNMKESTELLAFKRQKDGHKVTVKIFLFICVVLSWDELKVRQMLLASDYEMYMVCLLVATAYWHKSLQFVKKTNTLTLFIYDFIRTVSCFSYKITQKVIPKRIRLRLGITFCHEPRFYIVFSTTPCIS